MIAQTTVRCSAGKQALPVENEGAPAEGSDNFTIPIPLPANAKEGDLIQVKHGNRTFQIKVPQGVRDL